MSKELGIDEVCIELDSLSIRMLHLIKEYINVKMTIEDFIKTGSLHLAKARYIMGNRNVSALQLPTEDSNEIEASTTVLCKETNNDTGDTLALELNRLKINDKLKSEEAEAIRQRKRKDANVDSCKSTIQDPLKWFGVLVPQDMRHAQINFNKAIEHTIECTNIQLEILAIEQKYRSLLEKKRQLSEK